MNRKLEPKHPIIEGMIVVPGPNGTFVACVWPPVECPNCRRLVAMFTMTRDGNRCLTCPEVK